MPHYDRYVAASAEQNSPGESSQKPINEEVAEAAAEAIRQADLEAAQEEFDLSTLRAADLESMSIDELRVVARQLEVPDRAQITEQDELIAAIRQRL
jgi:hypothetical protein